MSSLRIRIAPSCSSLRPIGNKENSSSKSVSDPISRFRKGRRQSHSSPTIVSLIQFALAVWMTSLMMGGLWPNVNSLKTPSKIVFFRTNIAREDSKKLASHSLIFSHLPHRCSGWWCSQCWWIGVRSCDRLIPKQSWKQWWRGLKQWEGIREKRMEALMQLAQ